MLIQVLSRNNDVNGNPYRLVLLYDDDGAVKKAYEARSSSPNIMRELRQYPQLPTFHLAPAEYNETRRHYKEILQHVD